MSLVPDKKQFFRIVIPSYKEIVIMILLTLVIFFTFESNLLFLKVTRNSIFDSTELQQNFQTQIDAFFSDNQIANKISLVIFWAGVGLVAYSLIWSIYSFFNEAKSEAVVATTYINQENKHQKLQRSLLQAGILAGMIALGLLSLNVIAPFLIGLWTDGILKIPQEGIVGILQISAGFIGIALNLYAFKVLIDWIELID